MWTCLDRSAVRAATYSGGVVVDFPEAGPRPAGVVLTGLAHEGDRRTGDAEWPVLLARFRGGPVKFSSIQEGTSGSRRGLLSKT